MALLDVNALVALAWDSHVHHGRRCGPGSSQTGRNGWATCPMTESGFVRVSANPKVFPSPIGVDAARTASVGAARGRRSSVPGQRCVDRGRRRATHVRVPPGDRRAPDGARPSAERALGHVRRWCIRALRRGARRRTAHRPLKNRLCPQQRSFSDASSAQTMGVDPSILVTLLNPLEADGLVSRERASRRPPPRARRRSDDHRDRRRLPRAACVAQAVTAFLPRGLQERVGGVAQAIELVEPSQGRGSGAE